MVIDYTLIIMTAIIMISLIIIAKIVVSSEKENKVRFEHKDSIDGNLKSKISFEIKSNKTKKK